jgi:hypothetical protein
MPRGRTSSGCVVQAERITRNARRNMLVSFMVVIQAGLEAL